MFPPCTGHWPANLQELAVETPPPKPDTAKEVRMVNAVEIVRLRPTGIHLLPLTASSQVTWKGWHAVLIPRLIDSLFNWFRNNVYHLKEESPAAPYYNLEGPLLKPPGAGTGAPYAVLPRSNSRTDPSQPACRRESLRHATPSPPHTNAHGAQRRRNLACLHGAPPSSKSVVHSYSRPTSNEPPVDGQRASRTDVPVREHVPPQGNMDGD